MIRKARGLASFYSADDVTWHRIVSFYCPGVIGYAVPSFLWRDLSNILLRMRPMDPKWPIDQDVISYNEKAPAAVYSGDRKLLEAILVGTRDENSLEVRIAGNGVAENWLEQNRTSYLRSLLSNGFCLAKAFDLVDLPESDGNDVVVPTAEDIAEPGSV